MESDKLQSKNDSKTKDANRFAGIEGVSPGIPLPLYRQVKQYIVQRIKNGQWPPETRIPSENEITDLLKVSRMTVNRALRELTSEGHLVRIQGIGTFVARRKPVGALMTLRSISDEIAQWGGKHSCRVVLLKKDKAGKEVARAMGISPGAPVFRSVLVHSDNDVPVLYCDRYVNPLAAPEYLDQNFTRINPTDYLLKVAPLQELEHTVEAVIPEENIQTLLKLAPGEACLQVNRRTWSFNMVATSSRLVYPGTRYRLTGRVRAESHLTGTFS